MTDARTFEPRRHLTLINGNEYLEVKWRLVWMRSEHPDALIETELVSSENFQAIFRAKVTIPGGGSATGWGSEDAQSFGDYLEKAETKALGRALASLGYGTQFCPDFDFGAEAGRVVDSPISIRSINENGSPKAQRSSRSELTITGPQLDLIRTLARDEKMDDLALDEFAQEHAGRPVTQLLRRDASALIDRLQERKQARGTKSA